MATIKKQGNGYKITVSCGYDYSGKQIRKHKTWTPPQGMTAKQIEKELQRQAVLFEEQADGLSVGGSVKFQEFAEQWFAEYAEKKFKARTLERSHQLSKRAYTALGHLRMDKITPRHVQQFINNLSEDGVHQLTGKGLAPKTVLHYKSFVSGVFNYAIRMGIVQNNPCTPVVLPDREQVEHDCYTLEETQTFLNLLAHAPLKYQAFFVLAIYGGFRRGELLGLEWKDIDYQHNVVHIRRTSLYTKEKGIYTDTPKTKGSYRSLKLPADVLAVLKCYQAEQVQEIQRVGDQWEHTDRLFVKWNGLPQNPETTYNWLKKFCARENLRFLGIHSFRHLNASLLITSGADIRTVSASLGYSIPSTTLNIYAHTFAETQARASETIANAIGVTVKPSVKQA